MHFHSTDMSSTSPGLVQIIMLSIFWFCYLDCLYIVLLFHVILMKIRGLFTCCQNKCYCILNSFNCLHVVWRCHHVASSVRVFACAYSIVYFPALWNECVKNWVFGDCVTVIRIGLFGLFSIMFMCFHFFVMCF